MTFEHIVFLVAFVVLVSELFVVLNLQKRMASIKPATKKEIKKYYTSPEQIKKFEGELHSYMKAKKTNYEIGLMYERYLGYLLEMKGYTVEFSGAKKGMRDQGRDLIAKNGKETLIIQAKYWAKSKKIQSKHIEQLYGTTELYKRTHKNENVIAVLYSTTDLTEDAEFTAASLEVVFRHVLFNKFYPMIKCNISNNGDRIFHLPCDDYYDRIHIEPHKGEFYARSIAEAVAHDFRRAFKYKGKRAA